MRIVDDQVDEVPEEELFLPEIHMPDAERDFLKEHYEKANVILEYGSGGSTVYAASLGKKIFSVESDVDWKMKLEASINIKYPDAQLDMHWINIGETKDWGHPTSMKSYVQFAKYPLSIWDAENFEEPDLVLIDGRFRVGCFLASIFRTKKQLTLLWDDYSDRKQYHGIEKYFEPKELMGRMARFEIEPGTTIDNSSLLEIVQDFIKLT